MALNNMRFQIAAMMFLLIMIIFYSKGKKLPKLSTRWFSIMLGVTAINILFDMVTVYTIWNLDSVPIWFTRLSHQIVIASLNTIMFFYYLYINILVAEQNHLIKRKLIRRSPIYIVSLLFVIFGPIYYYNDGNIAYSYGPMVDMLYVSIAIYLCMIAGVGAYYRLIIRKEVLNSIIAGISLWTALGIVQYYHPGVLLSGLGTVLMIFLLYLSFENPKEQEEENTGLMNEFAFKSILNEWCRRGEVFCVANIILENYSVIYASMGKNEMAEEIKQIFKKPNLKEKGLYYHTEERTISLFLKGTKEEVIGEVGKLYEHLEQNNFELNLNLRFKIQIFECPTQVKTVEEVLQTIAFTNTEVLSFDKCENFRIMSDDHLNKIRRVFKVESLLKKAIDNDGIEVFYQPIFDTKSKCFLSAEALVRLKDNTTIGFVSPEEFISIAESNGLIIKLGDMIFEKICRFVKRTDLKSYGIEYVEVNLSGIQCIDKDLPKRLKFTMDRYEIPPNYFNFEITETVSVNGVKILEENMNILRLIGCSFSMDDFGTGYSNLSQIAEMAFELIKLDKSLVWGYFCDKDIKSKILFEQIVLMLEQLKIKIVAEGVETREQAESLSEMGIDYLQGYYYSRPVNEADFLTLLENRKCILEVSEK